MVDFSVVFVPLREEADDGVEEQDEEQGQDEHLLHTHVESRGGDGEGRWLDASCFIMFRTVLQCLYTLAAAVTRTQAAVHGDGENINCSYVVDISNYLKISNCNVLPKAQNVPILCEANPELRCPVAWWRGCGLRTGRLQCHYTRRPPTGWRTDDLY